jgi:outer membrane protein
MKEFVQGGVKAYVRLVGAAALLVPAALAAQDARPIPLDEAVRLARRNAPATVQSQNAIRQAAGTVRQRYAAFLPNLTLSSGVSNSEGFNLAQVADPANPGSFISVPRPFRQDWNGNHGLNANLQLFGGGNRLFQLQQARAQLDAAEAADVTQEFAIALQVKQQYFAVLAAREQRLAAQRQLESSEQQLRASVARVRAGAATRSDSLRTSIQVGNARLAILTAENQLANANASLARLIGSEVLVTAEEGGAGSETIAMTDTELLDNIERSPAVVQAVANQKAAREGNRSSLSQYLPTVSVTLGRSYSGRPGEFQLWGDGDLNSTRTNYSVSWQLFNGLNREQQVLQSRITQDNAEAQLRDARLNARAQLIQQIGAFRTAEVRVQIQLASVAAGEEDLRVQQERYNLGASTLLDVLNSQSTLDQARRDLIQARLDARTAKAQLEALVGRDL